MPELRARGRMREEIQKSFEEVLQMKTIEISETENGYLIVVKKVDEKTRQVSDTRTMVAETSDKNILVERIKSVI
jgi:nitrate reductase NapAB chaperone NapD